MASAGEESISEGDEPIGTLSFFKDINPETDCRSAFVRKLSYAGGRANLRAHENTPQEVIELQLDALLVTDKKHDPTETTSDCLTIVPRANPKGVSQTCEMCPEKANLYCRKCNVTYYCSWTHREMDSIHSQLCSRIKILRWPMPYCNDIIHRQRCAAQKILVMEKLLEDLLQEAFTVLYEKKNFNKAIGLLFQCLNYVTRVFGEGNEDVQLITIYTAICESQLCLGQLSQAENSLNTAALRLRAAEDRTPTPKLDFANALVNKAQGLLKFATGQYEDAAFYLSEYIYYVSEVTNPTDFRACTGYFELGKCFLASGETEKGFSVIKFCLQLWHKFLGDMFILSTKIASRKSRFFRSTGPEMSLFTKLQATKQLDEAIEIVGTKKKVQSEIYCTAVVCQGIMAYFRKEYNEARGKMKSLRSFEDDLSTNNPDVFNMCKRVSKMSARRLAEMGMPVSDH